MFIQNKYTNWYLGIIKNAKEREIAKQYMEKHHIYPKSLGGNNEKSNIVCLTSREHFICHLLLPKMLIESDQKRKMYYALHRMSFSKSQNHEQRYVPTSRRFEQIRNQISEGLRGRKMSEETKEKLRNKIVSEETRQKMSKALIGRVFSVETKLKMSNSQKTNPKNKFIHGFEKTPEHCANISKGKKGKSTNWSTPENRKAVSESLKGRKFSDEHRKNMSLARLGKPKTEEAKQKLKDYYAAKRNALHEEGSEQQD